MTNFTEKVSSPLPLVSLICPTFNGLALLKETLPPLISSLSSLPLKTELVIVDNGSVDGTGVFIQLRPSTR